MVTSDEVRNRLADAIEGQLSFDEFEDWLVQCSRNVHQSKDFDLQRLVFAIELPLAERSSGHLDDEGLLRELRTVLSVVPVNLETEAAPIAVKSGSSSSLTLQQALDLQMQLSGRSPVMAFGLQAPLQNTH